MEGVVRHRDFDVVIFGASGFTGRYVVREALRSLGAHSSPLKTLALAGRNASKLAGALEWAAAPLPPPPVPLLLADVSDPDSMLHLFRRARLVLNCVGPFRLYGAPVLSACVETGADYLDICGEPEFMERMEAEHHEDAVRAGTLVVSACGFDAIPAELGLMFNTAQWIAPAAPNQVEAYLSLESERRIVGNIATYESAVLGVASSKQLLQLRRSRPRKARPVIPGPPPSKGPIVEHQKMLGLWAVRLPSADASVVRRTLTFLTENPHGLHGAGESENHAERRRSFWSTVKPAHFGVKLGGKSIFDVIRTIVTGLFIGLLSTTALGRWLLIKHPEIFTLGWFRQSGPTEEEVSSATFRMWFIGHGFKDAGVIHAGGAPDTEIVTRVSGPEIGYAATSIILIQCALVLLDSRQSFPRGGVFPPGIIFGPTNLRERLQENGFSFDVVSKRALEQD